MGKKEVIERYKSILLRSFYPNVESPLPEIVNFGQLLASGDCSLEDFCVLHNQALQELVTNEFGIDIGSITSAATDVMSDILTAQDKAKQAQATALEQAREQLEAEKQRFRDFADSGSDFFWETDAEHRITYVSISAGEVLSAPPDSFVGKAPQDYLTQEHFDAVWRSHQDDLDARNPFRDTVFEVLDDDGRIHWVRVSGNPIFAEDGEFLGYRGTGSEVTGEVEAESAAAQAKNRLTDSIEYIDEGFVLFDSRGNLVICNDRYRAAYPLVEDLLVPGVNIEDVLRAAAERGSSPSGLEDLEQWVSQRLERHANSDAIIECMLGNGQCYRISERQTLEGGVIKVLMDITELRAREQELAEKLDLLGTTLENMVEGLTLMDENLDLVLTNQRAVELLGFPPELFRPGTNAADIFRYNARRGEYGEGDVEQLVAVRIAKAKQFEPHVFERTRPDGVILEVRGNPIPEGGGFVTTYTDVTSRVETELSLRQSESRLRLITDALPALVISIDKDLRYQFVNQTYLDWYGLERDDILGRTMTSVLGEDRFQKLRPYVEQVLDGETVTFEFEGHYPGVGFKKVENTYIPEYVGEKEIWGFYVLGTDVTDRLNAERQIRESEERYAVASAGANDGLYDWDIAGEIVYRAPRVHEILGFDADQTYADPAWWLSMIHEDDIEHYQTSFKDHLKGKTDFFECEYRVRFSQGRYRWILDRALAQRDAEGRAYRMAGSIRDVTDAKETEVALRESEAFLTESQLVGGVGSWKLDLTTGLPQRSFEADRILGVSAKHFDGSMDGFLALVHSEDRQSVIETNERVIRTHLVEECEYRIIRPDGQERTIVSRTAPVLDDKNEIVGLTGTLRDVTESKLAEQALIESEAQLNGIIENAPMVICMRDRDGTIVKSNRASDELVGEEFWPLEGKSLFEIFPQSLAEKLAEQDRAVVESRETRESDVVIDTPLGEREFHDVKFPILNTNGVAKAVVVISADNTEKNRADRKLHRARERLAEAVESMPNGFALFDSNERLILANSAYREVWPCAEHLVAEGVTATDIASAVADGGGVRFPKDDPGEWVRDRMERFRACTGEHEHQMIDGRWIVGMERKTNIGETVSIRIDVTDLKNAEEEVLTTRNRLIDAIESIDEAFALHDKDDRLVLYNSAFSNIFADVPHLLEYGTQFVDQIKARVEVGLIKDAIGNEEEYIEKRLDNHRQGGTQVLNRRDGTWIRISEKRTKEGSYVSIRTDITEIKKAEDQLRLSEERFRVIAETAPLPIIITDKEEGLILYASPRVEEVFGLSSKDMLGRTATDFYADPSERERVLAELNSTGILSGFELCALRDDGSEFWASVSIAPMIYDRKAATLACFADISAHKETETILRDNEQRLRTIIDNVVDGIAVIDRLGYIVTTNAALAPIFGYQSAELVGRPLTMLMPEPVRSEHDRYIDNYVETGEGKIIGQAPREVTGRHKDGSEVLLELAVSTYNVCADTYFVGALRDIGPRKTLEKQLLQTQKMEALGTLAGGVAHDLNNALVPIVGLSELVLDDLSEADEARDSLEYIHDAALRASRLVKQILAFSRQEEVEFDTLELSSTLSHMLDLLRATIPATVNIERHIGEIPIDVLADETQLHQVIMNLCVNAAQAIGDNPGTITVALDRVEIDKAMATRHSNLAVGPYACIRIGDDGHGIDEETRSRIFEPFFTTKGVGEGTRTVCRNLVF